MTSNITKGGAGEPRPYTSIGEMKDGVYALRGTPLPELINGADFVSALWLAWTGARPSADVRRLVEACLVACVDHGVEPPSTHTARVIASCGKPLADAVAAGLLTLGPRHGNAAGAACRWVKEAVASGHTAEQVVSQALAENVRLAGIGHPVYEADPRTEALFALARRHLASTAHLDLITEAARVLSDKRGKKMPVNVDGAIGAIVAELGVDPDVADAIFIVARSVGLVAHAREASAAEKYLRA